MKEYIVKISSAFKIISLKLLSMLKSISLDEWNNFLLFELQSCLKVFITNKAISPFLAKSLSVIMIISVT